MLLPSTRLRAGRAQAARLRGASREQDLATIPRSAGSGSLDRGAPTVRLVFSRFAPPTRVVPLRALVEAGHI